MQHMDICWSKLKLGGCVVQSYQRQHELYQEVHRTEPGRSQTVLHLRYFCIERLSNGMTRKGISRRGYTLIAQDGAWSR